MPLSADDISLQLCEPQQKAFTRAGWLFELKLDGFRMLAAKERGKARLLLRRGRDATAQFPEVARAIEALRADDFIIDGELVIQDEQGHPIFQRLLKRSTLKRPADIAAAARELPAVFFGFDLLQLGGEDLRRRPLRERKALLEPLLPTEGRARYHDHVEEQGEALLQAVKQQGLEGVVAKRADSIYRGERCGDWLKIALTHVADFAVVGYAADDGALHLAVHDGQGFTYAGKVGSGYGPKLARPIKARLEAARRETPAFAGAVEVEPDDVWVEPTLVAEVRYKNWPPGLSLREPVFLRFRDDKAPVECLPPAEAVRAVPPEPQVKLSNPRKIFWPDAGLTKKDLFDYYRAVSPWLLPYLQDRPLMLTRYPDGILGKSFFQKARPKGAPRWVRAIPVRDPGEGRALDQIVCDDLRTLEWVANLGAIALHVPAARASSLDRPDWVVIDFDPKDAPFAHVVTLANSLRGLCDAVGLPSYVKTSGSSGLHVLVPLGRQCDQQTGKQLAELLVALLEGRHPQLATTERMLRSRQGRVYLDAGQNGPGKLIAAPLGVRALPGAPVSMPLWWDEVGDGLQPRQFTLRDAVARLKARGDPMAEVLRNSVPLEGVLTKLAAQLRPAKR